MDAFTYSYTTHPSRVIFGSGTLTQLPAELQRLSFTSPLLLSTPRQIGSASSLSALLVSAGIMPAGIFAEATMHTPTNITYKALTMLTSSAADCIVSIGGGSTIGLGKALSVRSGLHHVCIPTTYAGSEMTPILGETADGVKMTRSDPKILPGAVVYDVNLTMTLPAGMTATSGVNAIAHAVEALYATNANPVTSMMAVEGIRALASALPTLAKNVQDRPARELALYGAWLCGACLGVVGMGLHHKLCHTLGGSFNLPHAQTHTVVLPHALAYNMPCLSEVVKEKLAGAFPGADGDVIRGVNKLIQALGVERSLKAYGMREEDVDTAAELATSNPYENPRAVVREEIREVIRRAWAGDEARDDI